MNRRQFIQQSAIMTGIFAGGTALLSSLGSTAAYAAQVHPDDPELASAMKQAGKSFEYKIYPNAPHAFNNDTNPERYQPEAAKEAWAKTLEFFKKHLQSDA